MERGKGGSGLAKNFIEGKNSTLVTQHDCLRFNLTATKRGKGKQYSLQHISCKSLIMSNAVIK